MTKCTSPLNLDLLRNDFFINVAITFNSDQRLLPHYLTPITASRPLVPYMNAGSFFC